MMHVQILSFARMPFPVHPESMRNVFKKGEDNKPGEKKQSMKERTDPIF
jgi:hypothetical protein